MAAHTPPGPVRFGVLCHGTNLARWQVQILEHLVAVPRVQLAAVIVGEPQPTSKLDLLKAPRRKRLLFDVHRQFQARPRQTQSVDASALLANATHRSVEVERRGRWSEYLLEPDLEWIRDQNLDFLLRFGFGILRGDVLDAARYGIWSYHHDDERRYRGGPPCFWEVARGDPASGVILQRLTERLDGGIVLRRGRFPTERSLGANMDRVYGSSVRWPAALAHALASGEPWVLELLEGGPSPTDAPIYHAPGNLRMAGYLARQAGRAIHWPLWQATQHPQWSIGLVDAPAEALLERETVGEVKPLLDVGRHGFYADPFAVEEDGVLHVLYENLDHRINQATISAATVEGDSTQVVERDVFPVGAHQSYPYLFQDGGETYCVPETASLRRVPLYRAIELPHRWEFVTDLLPGRAIYDATLFRHGSRWWMAGADADLDGHADSQLCLWYADSLEGEWTPHPRNPVAIDCIGARPAGPPFMAGDRLVRPAQDCSDGYGRRVVFQEIQDLSPASFRETPLGTLGPEPGSRFPHSLHTVCPVGDRTLVDVKRHAFVPRAFGRIVRSRLPGARG